MTTYIRHGTPEFRRINLALFIGAFVIFASLYAVQPLLPTFASTFHVHPAAASLSLSLSTAGMAIGLLIMGSLSEAYGRKSLMVISLFSVSVLTVLSAFCSSFPLFLIVRAVEGVALAGLPATAMAYLGEEIAPASLGIVMGLYISGNSVGGMVGRIVSGTIAPFFGWQVSLLVIGAFGLLMSFWFAVNLPHSRNFESTPLKFTGLIHSLWEHVRNPWLFALFILGFLLMGGFVTLYNYISFDLVAPPYHLPQHIVSWIFILYVVGTLSSTWMGSLADQFGRHKVLWVSIVLMLLGVIVTLFQPLLLKILGIGLSTFGFFGGHSIASSWIGHEARTHKAQASALYLFFYYMGSSIGGTGGGAFWASHGWPGVVSFIASFVVVALVLSVLLAAAMRRRSKSTKTLKEH